MFCVLELDDSGGGPAGPDSQAAEGHTLPLPPLTCGGGPAGPDSPAAGARGGSVYNVDPSSIRRHCERSEATQDGGAAPGLLRCARNDDLGPAPRGIPSAYFTYDRNGAASPSS